MRNATIAGIVFTTLAAIAVILGVAVAAEYVDRNARDGASKTRCGIDSGKVEFYDAAHDELWRCVRTERSGT